MYWSNENSYHWWINCSRIISAEFRRTLAEHSPKFVGVHPNSPEFGWSSRNWKTVCRKISSVKLRRELEFALGELAHSPNLSSPALKLSSLFTKYKFARGSSQKFKVRPGSTIAGKLARIRQSTHEFAANESSPAIVPVLSTLIQSVTIPI